MMRVAAFRNCFWLLLPLIFLASASCQSKDRNKDKVTRQPDAATAPHPILVAQSVAFITFTSGEVASRLKSQATQDFSKWKHYQVLEDPSHADLVILLGPMPRKVDADDWTALLDGKASTVKAEYLTAAPQFAVFDAKGSRNSGSASFQALWSTELTSVGDATKKYRKLFQQVQDAQETGKLTYQVCYMLNLSGCYN